MMDFMFYVVEPLLWYDPNSTESKFSPKYIFWYQVFSIKSIKPAEIWHILSKQKKTKKSTLKTAKDVWKKPRKYFKKNLNNHKFNRKKYINVDKLKRK